MSSLADFRISQPNLERSVQRQRVFRYLLVLRWTTLVPVLAAILAPSPATAASSALTQALLLAIVINAALTLFQKQINSLLNAYPILLGIDLLLTAFLVWTTGAEASPFYLYSLTPILGAAYFFRIRGGLITALCYTALYLAAVFMLPPQVAGEINLSLAVGQMIGFFVIALVFGYASQLLAELQHTHDELTASNAELSRRNRDLHLLQSLTLLLQSSVDPTELEEYIVRGLVEEMGYRRAVIGLLDQDRNVLSSWLVQERQTANERPLGHTELISLTEGFGPLMDALHGKRVVEISDGRPATDSSGFAGRLVMGEHYLLLPLVLRENLLGILIVDELPATARLTSAELDSLERLAAHAGVALGSVRLCINRAQQQAVLDERNRIAADLHDSISQVLYGLAYGLDACVQLLPGHPETVRQELQKLQPVVADGQAQMRKAIFDMRSDEILSDTFSARLHRHLHAICPARKLALRIELPGDFDRLDSETRRHLYRIAQEAMTNAAKHAAAHRIVVTVTTAQESVQVRVEDDGRGFDVTHVDRVQHLGIQSMTERVEQLGGVLDIRSAPDQGTLVAAKIPQSHLAALPTP
ncbi:MAG: GAF domain-containing sensor histidine kinase [Caldilineales bacterium]|nr:GAF domain-containing sensor histidine kinase [Caldilineales bacterium]